MIKAWQRITIGLICGFAAGCSTLPGGGPRPTAFAFTEAASSDDAAFRLVELDKATARSISDETQLPHAALSARSRALGVLGPGDLLRVFIWEQGPTALTMTTEKPALDITLRVGQDGTVSMPYSGRFRVAGLTLTGVEDAIHAKLAGEARGLQVSVLLVEEVAGAVMVQGEVVKPGRYGLQPGSRRILDVLALAGGTRPGTLQQMVQVTRGNQSIHRSVTSLKDEGDAALLLEPGDRILVYPREEHFFAFGAVNRPGEYPLTVDDTTLTRTLARISGLADTRADASAVFIYRPVRTDGDEQIVYKLDLRDPQSFFVASEFHIKPNDVIYVGEAPFTEVSKVLQLVTVGTSVERTMTAN